MSDPIYLDHAATTPLRPEARAAMEEGFALWANPSSPHAAGRRARAALEEARERIKDALDWDGELIFTSGASEAAALAMQGAVGGRRFVSAVEHDAILNAVPEATVLPVGADGDVLEIDAAGSARIPGLEEEARPIVAVQHVNSETGAEQDIGLVAEQVHARKGLLVVDCSQSAGKMAFPLEADMAIVSAHKFGGPIGIGALLVKDFAMLVPVGGQERGYRRGTENLPGILGMAAALEACESPYIAPEVLFGLGVLPVHVEKLGGVWLSDSLSLPTDYIHTIVMPRVSGRAQLMRFDMAGISVSQGSACSSGTLRRSPVLEAMGFSPDVASRAIRISFGWNTVREDLEEFTDAWLRIASRRA